MSTVTRKDSETNSEPYQELGQAFKAAMVAVRRLRGRETHHPGQLSYAQFGLLHSLSGMCELSARDIAEQANLTPATVTQMLDALEAAGLVKRERSEQDRRVVLSSLTERGEQVITERHAEMEAKFSATLSEFSDEELHAAARVLDRLAVHFTQLGQSSAEITP
jgi:MarR family transcriptional regulator, organic hydroperoxide resistance regulator